jgi:hypothetical protein
VTGEAQGISEQDRQRTPEQAGRVNAERNGSDFYDDGRPKMHRHFAEFAVHRDDECNKPSSRRIRVYVFDTEDLERHEAFISDRERAAALADRDRELAELRATIADAKTEWGSAHSWPDAAIVFPRIDEADARADGPGRVALRRFVTAWQPVDLHAVTSSGSAPTGQEER